MTTIITIVVVALVFFVTVCVVAFMIWKRETEMRTDSIKAIEQNLEEMLYELTGSTSREIRRRMSRDESLAEAQETLQQTAGSGAAKENCQEPVRKTGQDPEDRGWTESDTEKNRINGPGAAIAAPEDLTVFEPVIVKYESFDTRKEDHRDGKRGLKWREVAEEQLEEEPQPEEEQQPEILEEPEPEIKEEHESLRRFPHIFKRHKKQDEEEQEEPVQYESIDDLLRDYISEPPAVEEPEEMVEDIIEEPEYDNVKYDVDYMYDALNENLGDVFDEDYRNIIMPGYNIGRSGKKYTAAELEELIKE